MYFITKLATHTPKTGQKTRGQNDQTIPNTKQATKIRNTGHHCAFIEPFMVTITQTFLSSPNYKIGHPNMELSSRRFAAELWASVQEVKRRTAHSTPSIVYSAASLRVPV